MILLSLVVIFATCAYGLDFSVCAGGSSGSVSMSGSYNLDTSTELGLNEILGQGTAYQERQVEGSGQNNLTETMSGGQYTLENTISSLGKISGTSKSAALNDAGFTDISTSISGENGFIESASVSEANTVLIAGGYSQDGNLQSDLTSSADMDKASIAGTATVLGAECYNDDVAQFLSSGDSALTVQGINQASNGGMGEFGLTAANIVHSGKYAVKPAASATSESNGYLFAGWRWPDNAQKQMQLSGSSVPGNLANGQDDAKTAAAKAICKAANTWDSQTNEDLFLGIDNNNDPSTGNAAVAITTYTPKYSNRPAQDGKNTEAWTTGFGKGSSILALTITWYSNSKSDKVVSYDGVSRSKVLESDCWYNANFNWRIAPDGDTSKGAYDVQTISLHELGHTLGLSDLYAKSNSDKVMYGYNDGSVKRTLTTQDIAGLQKLYGP